MWWYFLKRTFGVVLAGCLFVGFAGHCANAQPAPLDPFATSIRATDPLPPAEQQKKFQLPDGDQINRLLFIGLKPKRTRVV
jgi:hypothetical protein